MHNPNPDILVYIAIADAYGAAAEYLPLPAYADVHASIMRFDRYVKHPTHDGDASLYTDDGEMSTANARVLIEHDAPYTPKMFADAYVREFLRGGWRKGYSRGFQALLEKTLTGDQLLATLKPDSDKSGAIMRAPVLGALRTVDQVLEVATLQARITHDTPEGRFSARAGALMAHYGMYERGPLRDVWEYCAAHLPREDVDRFGLYVSQPWPDGVAVTKYPLMSVGVTTTRAALHLVSRCDSLMGILRTCIEWGGDVDSVAAVAWGIASARYQDEPLPEFMRRDLERGNPNTGTPYLRAMGERLMQKYA